ncbi:MAG: methyltransferase [Anaerolineales bacterium]|nr:methyltransferase [Anaerolineales bacterium]
MADYYSFGRFTIEQGANRLIVVGKPGVWSWDRLNPGTEALLEMVHLGVVQVTPGAAVLDLGCGTGVIGAALAALAPEAQVTLVDCDAPAIASAERTVAANHLTNARVQLGDGTLDLPDESVDLVVSHLPRGQRVQEELIAGAARVLRPEGHLCFVASKQAGVKGAVEAAGEQFGRCGVIRQKKGYHVAMATKPDGAPSLLPRGDGCETRSVVIDGAATTLVSKPGVFAWDRLDEGTARLIETMQIREGDRVLDLGCGTGLAGLAAGRRAGGTQVVLVDADVRAVTSARRTLAANGLTNAEVVLSDCASAVLGRGFDVVITNPPFHRELGVDYEVAFQFVRDAARVLAPGGRLFLVTNAHLRYDAAIRSAFGNVAVAYEDNRYRVLTAVAKAGPGGHRERH